uniref:Uncharacterized protein n=1 Tax=mine drainage metagenome TaxID=410659 RepID=E6PXY2_9ZZZZ
MRDVRAAVERHWADTQRAAAYVLGDEALATEIMETAIKQAVAYLADHPPGDQEDVAALLSRFCRQEIKRRRKERAQFVLIDFSVTSETASPNSSLSAVDAAIDVERILADAPPKVREAMMLRYGFSESWGDVAARTETSSAGVRMSCKRYLDSIRQKLGIPGAAQ